MGYVFFSQRTRKSLYPKDLDFNWPQLTSVSTGIFLTKVQTVKKSNSACYSYNFYFYLYIKFYLSCFTFYNVWISKCLYLWHLNKSLIHIKLPANLACFGKSHISLNSLKLVLSTSLSLFKLDNDFFFWSALMYRIYILLYKHPFCILGILTEIHINSSTIYKQINEFDYWSILSMHIFRGIEYNTWS